MTIVSFGGAAAIKWGARAFKYLGKAGKILEKILGVVTTRNKVDRHLPDEVGDLIPDKKKELTPDKSTDKKKKDSKDNKEEENDLGENAKQFAAAKIITETLDGQPNSPSIPSLLSKLNTSSKTKLKGGKTYQAEPNNKGEGHYRIFFNPTVDSDYTPGSNNRKFTQGKWGNLNRYGGIYETAIDHIKKGHYYNSRPGEKSSRFLKKYSNIGDIKSLTNEAISLGKHSGSAGNYSITHTFEYIIGTTSSGRKTNRLRVYLDSQGNVLNSYPIK